MKNKLLIIVIIVVIVFCVPIILLKKASNSALSLARQIPMNLAREYAGKLGGKIDGYIEALQSLSNEMSFYENLPLETRRREYEKTMQSVFEKTPEFIQMFTVWKPNAIDGMDARYTGRVGSTYTGQFAYALTRDTGQITHMTSTVVNETITQITGPNGSVIAVSGPVPFKNMGLDTYAVRITVPIINKRLNEIVGAVGCQLDISMIQPLLQTAIKENDEIAAMSVYANTGLIIASYSPYRIGKNMLDTEVQFGSYINDSFEAVKNSKEYLCFSFDPTLKANMQIAIANVSIGSSPITWSVMIGSTEDYIMRDVKAMTKIIVLLMIIAVVVVIIVIVLLFKRAKTEKELKEKTERETREKTQAEEREQQERERLEKYIKDILSGVISYDEEFKKVQKIEEEFLKYKSNYIEKMKKVTSLIIELKEGTSTGRWDSMWFRETVDKIKSIKFDSPYFTYDEALLSDLYEIKGDSRINKLKYDIREACSEFQSFYNNHCTYISLLH
jgi:methyl-accepting chemotaxis protein